MGIIEHLGDFESPREHTYGKPHVTEEGMRRINRTLDNRHGLTIPPGFAPLIETSRGKLAGRVEKLMRDFHNIKLSLVAKQEIGNLIEQYAVKGSSYIFDFTYEILTWDRGSFGNNQSCWRSQYAASVPMFKIGTGHGPGFAIRTFVPRLQGTWYEGMIGNGRSWIMPYADDRIVMFNPYGDRLPVFVSILKSVLPQGMYQTKEVRVENNSEGIYMNNAKGIAVFPSGSTQNDRLVLSMPRHYTKECKGCSARFGTPDGEAILLCEECRGKCAVTQKIVRIQDLAEVYDINVLWKGKSYYIERGLVGLKIQEKLRFCHDCLRWRGDLDEC
jgi:hypothetical protein